MEHEDPQRRSTDEVVDETGVEDPLANEEPRERPDEGDETAIDDEDSGTREGA